MSTASPAIATNAVASHEALTDNIPSALRARQNGRQSDSEGCWPLDQCAHLWLDARPDFSRMPGRDTTLPAMNPRRHCVSTHKSELRGSMCVGCHR